jgi:5-methylcytosine-specific restriction endonuclease McrA
MRLCSGPGCGRAVPDNVRFCAECKSERQSNSDGIRAVQSDRERYGWIYTSERWVKYIRPKVLRRQPMCARCRTNLSQIVDHIVPIGVAIAQAQQSGKYLDKYAGAYLLSNLQGLCRVCHRAKTDEDKLHTGPWPNIVEVETRAPKKMWSF